MDAFKREHKDLICKPSDAAERKRLENMYDTLSENCARSYEALHSLRPLLKGVTQTGIITVVDASASMEFEGIGMCPHCIKSGVMYLRDTANTLEDIMKAMGVEVDAS